MENFSEKILGGVDIGSMYIWYVPVIQAHIYLSESINVLVFSAYFPTLYQQPQFLEA